MKVKTFPILLLALLSCSQLETTGPDPVQAEPVVTDLSTIMVDPTLPFYSDISEQIGQPLTKAGSEMVSLESLLNRYGIRTVSYQGGTLTQIPFKDTYKGPKAYFGPDPNGDPEKAVEMKRFLIIHGLNCFVVSLITDKQYSQTYPDFDYIDKPNYTGAIIFSGIMGKVIKLQVYINGLTVEGDFVKAGDPLDPSMRYLTVKTYVAPKTKAWEDYDDLYGGELQYSICIADREDYDQYWPEFGNNGDNEESHNNHGGGGGSGGKGGHGRKGGDKKDKTEENLFTVTLSSNYPQYFDMVGSGTYTEGSTVSVGYTKKVSVVKYNFSHWSGAFSGRKTATFSFKVTADVESTAYFGVEAPCHSNATGKTNPLVNMAVAASNNNGNYWGGTYGWTRTDSSTGEAKMHTGLDLYAEVGTPVFAAYGGEIVAAVSSYGNNYVDRSFGNELRIETSSGGKTFTSQYAHLKAGTPFATNPRTGKPYAVGDKVQQGDLIGFTGRTGNATDVPNPHLHFGIQVGGSWTDPKPYINGTYDSNMSAINKNKGKVTNNRCD